MENQNNISIKLILEKSIKDAGFAFEKESISYLTKISKKNIADYIRLRSKLKKSNKNISLTKLDSLVYSNSKDTGKTNREAEELLDFVNKNCELFHNFQKEGFVTIQNRDGCAQTWRIDSSGFEEWVRSFCFAKLNKIPSAQTISSTIKTLNGIAKFNSPLTRTHLRAAKHANNYLVDLSNEKWTTIEITPGKQWKVIVQSPVKFCRTPNMQPLPEPTKDGNVQKLWDYVNISPDDKILVLAFMLECFRPDTPFPVLQLFGRQGSAKSTTQNIIRSLIDPSSENLRSAPKNAEDIFIAANNNWLISYNNISNFPRSYQDSLCSLSTGGGYSTRKLFHNSEEILISSKRPVILNGITPIATSQDLIDRIISIELQAIDYYLTENDLMSQFDIDKPSIFGGLLDLFSQCLKQMPAITLPRPPRMADFAILGEALQLVLGVEDMSFTDRYNLNKAQTAAEALDSSPVAVALQDLLEEPPDGFEQILIKDLLTELEQYRTSFSNWPQHPRGLSEELRRLTPALKYQGIMIEFSNRRTKRGFHLNVWKQHEYDNSDQQRGVCDVFHAP